MIAPIGATRLLLGVMDAYSWYDNEGAFAVQVVQTAPPSRIQISLHPCLNPTAVDSVATPSRADILAANVSASPSPIEVNSSPGPELHAFTAIELSWASEANRLYQLQWTASLDHQQWVDLGPVVAGSGANMSLFDSTRRHPQGFYRVRILPG